MKFDLLCYIVKYLYILLTDQDNECWRSSQETLVPEDVEPENGWYDLSTPGFIYSTIFLKVYLLKEGFFVHKNTGVLFYDNCYICTEACNKHGSYLSLHLHMNYNFRVILNNHCTRQWGESPHYIWWWVWWCNTVWWYQGKSSVSDTERGLLLTDSEYIDINHGTESWLLRKH